MKLPDHLSVFEGDLWDNRSKPSKVVRANYSKHVRDIKTVADVKACLREGSHPWPGGYTCFFITAGGGVLSFEAAREEFDQIAYSLRFKQPWSGWHVIGLGCTADEDETPVCDHTGKDIN